MDLTFIAAKPFGRTIRKVLKAWHVELVRRRRIIYDECSSPGADDYLIDVDYQIDVSRCSSTCWVVAESEA